MLTPEELERVPDRLVKLYRALQLSIMDDIIGRVSAFREISRTADWQISRLYELGESKRAIKKRIRDALGLTTREINRIYKEVIWQDYARYEPVYRTKGRPWIPFEKNLQLQQLVGAVRTQTLGEFKNITQSLGFAVKKPSGKPVFLPLSETYQSILDNASAGMLSGAFDYNTMLKKAVKELTDSGLRTIDYFTEQDDGSVKKYTSRVEVAARRALMTGFNQVVGRISEDNAEQLGTDHFEVTYHRGARPTHQPWQGRVYTKEELVTVCGYGEVTGLKGANCYHDFHPFFEDISKRLYTDEQLDKMNAEENTPKEYKGRDYTAYEATQRQRSMESRLRRRREEIHLLEKGGASEDDVLAAKAKYHALSSEYAQFSKAMKLPQQRERISIDGRKGVDVSIGKPVEKAKKTIEKAVENSGEPPKSSTAKTNKPSTNYFVTQPEIIENTIENSGHSGIIELPKPRLRVNIQLFAEKDLAKQSTKSIQKGIKSLEERVLLHKNKINDPSKYIPDYDSLDERYKSGILRHWEKEIEDFTESINNRVEELKKRGDI